MMSAPVTVLLACPLGCASTLTLNIIFTIIKFIFILTIIILTYSYQTNNNTPILKDQKDRIKEE